MISPELLISGPEAESVVESFGDWCEAEFGERPSRLTQRENDLGDVDKADGMSIATFLIAVPAFLLAVHDLSDRTQVLDRAKRIITWAKEQSSQFGTVLKVRFRDGRVVRLDEAEPTDLFDRIIQQNQPPQVDLIDRIQEQSQQSP
ncbi:MAG: hypothetical protein R3C02_21600 [Planctomycetaceae bacterium]